MIEKIECERMICDGCGDVYSNAFDESVFTDVEHLAINLGSWVKDGNRHYCRNCAKTRGLVE